MGGLGAEVESAGKKPVLPAIKWEERGVPGNLRAKVRSEGVDSTYMALILIQEVSPSPHP